jgi:hypothetical protein
VTPRGGSARLDRIVQHAVKETLTDHQRRFFVAIAVNGDPLDAMVSGSARLFRCTP